MNSFEIIKGQGGVPKEPAGKDHVCGWLAFLPEAEASEESEVRCFVAYDEAVSAYAEQMSLGYKVLLYQLKELYRMQPAAKVWIKVASCGEATPYDEADLSLVKELQTASGGECRQIGVWNGYATGTQGDVQALQEAANAMESVGSPCNILYSAGGTTTAWAATSGVFKRIAGCSNVSWIIGQDMTADSEAVKLAEQSGAPAVSALGAALGCLAKAAVNESIAWVAKFNLGYDKVGFCDKKTNAEVGSTAIASLDEKGFIFLVKYDGLTGSYWSDSHTLDVASSNYSTIESERTIDKACRGVRSYLLPYLGSPVYISDDGTLRADSLAVLKNVANQALEQMERDGELSGFEVEIDPKQNVLANSTLEFVIRNVAVGVIRHIKVKIGYTTNIE